MHLKARVLVNESIQHGSERWYENYFFTWVMTLKRSKDLVHEDLLGFFFPAVSLSQTTCVFKKLT